MPNICPISDLRNNFAEITREVQASKESVLLTKNGVGSIVVMSMEAYEEGRYESAVYDKPKEAELQALETSERRSHEESVGHIADKLDALQAAADLLVELDENVQRIFIFPYAHELYRTTRPMRDEIRKVPVKGYVLIEAEGYFF